MSYNLKEDINSIYDLDPFATLSRFYFFIETYLSIRSSVGFVVNWFIANITSVTSKVFDYFCYSLMIVYYFCCWSANSLWVSSVDCFEILFDEKLLVNIRYHDRCQIIYWMKLFSLKLTFEFYLMKFFFIVIVGKGHEVLRNIKVFLFVIGYVSDFSCLLSVA